MASAFKTNTSTVFPGALDNFGGGVWDPAIGLAVDALEAQGISIFSVLSYGAKGNGVADDTAAVQAAITAATAVNGAVFVPIMCNIASGPLSITAPCQFQGTGWASGFSLPNGVNTYVATYNPPASSRLDGVSWRDLKFACNAANQATGGGGINAQNSAYCTYQRLWFDAPWDWAISFNGDGLGGFGHHNVVTGCRFQHGTTTTGSGHGGGLSLVNSDENMITSNDFEAMGSGVSSACAIFDSSGLQTIIGNTFVADPNKASVEQVKLHAGNPSRVIGNVFDGGTNHQLEIDIDYCSIVGNHFYQPISGSDCILISGRRATITGNIFTSSSTNNASNAAIDASTASGPNIITGNTIQTNGTWNTSSIFIVGTTGAVCRSNYGFNPLTTVAPAFPTTTSTYTNNTGVDVYAYITNGTGTMTTTVNGNTGPAIPASTLATVFIPAGGTFVPTYASGSPAWVFEGN